MNESMSTNDKTFYILDSDNTDAWSDAVKVKASSHREASDMDAEMMAVLEDNATDLPATAKVLVSEHKDGRDAVKFELSVRVTWTYGVKEIT